MQNCRHDKFSVSANVVKVSDTEGGPSDIMAEIRIKCDECNMPFKFKGLGVGLSYLSPKTDLTGEELRAPIEKVTVN